MDEYFWCSIKMKIGCNSVSKFNENQANCNVNGDIIRVLYNPHSIQYISIRWIYLCVYV